MQPNNLTIMLVVIHLLGSVAKNCGVHACIAGRGGGGEGVKKCVSEGAWFRGCVVAVFTVALVLIVTKRSRGSHYH